MSEFRKPNLYMIGAMKSGTTSLHNYLNVHPAIFMCEPKEPGYFAEEIGWNKGLQWYQDHFQGVSDEHQFIGESSTYYTKLPTHQHVISKLQEFCPADSRFIYVMRHPFRRIVSQYWHDYRQLQFGGVQANILDTCRNDPIYVQYSDYAMQLKPYIEAFGRDKILLLTFEELVADPVQTTQAVCAWLGLKDSDSVDWSAVGKKHNNNPDTIVGIQKNKQFLNAIRYSSVWSRVSALVPKSWRTAMSASIETTTTTEEQAEETRQLQDILAGDMRRIVDDISTLTGSDYHQVWTDLKP